MFKKTEMQEKEIEEYMSKVINGDITLRGTNRTAQKQLQEIAKNMEDTDREIQKLKRSLELAETLKKRQIQMYGQMQAYTALIIDAEDKRRRKGKK